LNSSGSLISGKFLTTNDPCNNRTFDNLVFNFCRGIFISLFYSKSIGNGTFFN
jgi:hypothetical protein